LKPLILHGEYELTVDEKNRMLVPAEIRRQLVPDRDGEAFFLITGINGRPWLYPEGVYALLVDRDPTELTPHEDALDYDLFNLGLASRLEWDKQGRVLFPDRFVKRSGLGKDVTLVGARNHLELWDRQDWEAKRTDLLRKSAELALKARQVRNQPPTEV